MISVSAINQGDTLYVRYVLYDEDGDLANADAPPTVELWKDGRCVIPAQPMSHTGIGHYLFRLNTSVLATGKYHVVCRARVSGWPVVETRTVEVVKPWESSTS